MGVPKDEKRAAQLYGQSAEQGEARAMYLLGECYEKGAGVEQDLAKARELYRQAADKKYQKALDALERLDAPQQPAGPKAPKQPAPSGTKERRGFRWPFGRK